MRTTIQTEIIINAPLEIVWNTLMQFEHYPNWNPFIQQIIGDAKVGNKIKVTLQDPQKNKMSFHAVVLNKQENLEFKWRVSYWSQVYLIENIAFNLARLVKIKLDCSRVKNSG